MSDTNDSKAKHPGGRPRKYDSPEQMQIAIDKYFDDCEGKFYCDKNDVPVLDKWGNEIWIGRKPPTITGLALALGFNSRQSLLNYEDKAEFVDTVMRGKSRVEAYAESRLFDKDGANGAKFSLANNFRNWNEKQSLDITANVQHSLSNLTDEELDAKIKALSKVLGD